jgi:uncharacterized protein YggT (Ycf19 family)
MHQLICYALAAYIVILLGRAAFCVRATEPVLSPVRGLIPVVQIGGAGLDLSFMVVFFVLIIIWQIFCG